MFPTIKLIKTYSYEDRKIVYSPSSHNLPNFSPKFEKKKCKDHKELILDKDSFKKTSSFNDPYAYPN